MRHKGVDKEETQRRVLEAVGRGFRKHGYAGIGVDGLSKAAGVTSGAFYSHLKSKERAFDAALAAGFDEVIDAVPKFQLEFGCGWVKAFAEYYLGEQHRNDLEGGCAMAALTPEVVRLGSKMQAPFEKKMTLIADLVALGLKGDSDEDRRARAWSMLGILIGGLNIARAMSSEVVSTQIAKAIKASAIDAAGETQELSSEERDKR